MSTPPGYILDNSFEATSEHHAALAQLLDPVTRRHICELLPRGWPDISDCLEVGAGSGSISSWLAERGSHVVATDLKPWRIPHHRRLQVVEHDLTDPQPWPLPMAGPFDLILARLVLSHLPQRATIMEELVQRLAPGGALLIQAWMPVPAPEVVVAAATEQDAQAYRSYQRMVNVVFSQAGMDRTWPRRIHLDLTTLGLSEVNTSIHGDYWLGGGPGLRMVAAVATQLRPKLIAAGMTTAELDHLHRLVTDPHLVVHSHVLYTTSGRRADTAHPSAAQ